MQDAGQAQRQDLGPEGLALHLWGSRPVGPVGATLRVGPSEN